MTSSTDQIEKRVELSAPVERVWRAISDAEEFGRWFGVRFDGPFVEGATVSGRIVPTTVDPEVARMQEPHAGKPFEAAVVRIDPPRHFAFRWHPYAVDPDVKYEEEPTTLVSFELTPIAGGTLLVIRESGFDAIPLERRAEAFRSNEGGWEAQTMLIRKYLEMNGGA